jgi:methionyl-tRNA formyltransferase
VQIAVAATPEVAIPTLDLLLQSEYGLAAVITQPDRPSGRGRSMKESPVATWATANNVVLHKPNSQSELAELAANFDLIATIGFGMIIKESILELPKYGFINLHFSLLPRWRGAAPVQRAIEAGDAVTGVTVFKLDQGMDTGPIYRQSEFVLDSSATTQSLLSELADFGAPLVLETIAAIIAGESARVQPISGASRAEKLSKDEGRIDWKLSAEMIERKVRAFYPNPGTWTTFRGSTLKIESVELSSHSPALPGEIIVVGKELYVSCGSGTIKVVSLKPAGKSTMSGSAWLNGAQVEPSDKFL